MFLQIALSKHRVPRKFIVLGRHFPQLYNLASHRVAPPKKNQSTRQNAAESLRLNQWEHEPKSMGHGQSLVVTLH
jgi:hypothetical protein